MNGLKLLKEKGVYIPSDTSYTIREVYYFCSTNENISLWNSKISKLKLSEKLDPTLDRVAQILKVQPNFDFSVLNRFICFLL